MTLIETFYQALSESDITKVKSCVNEKMFQANIQHTHQFQTIDEFVTYYENHVNDIEIINNDKYGAKYYLSILINNQRYATKLTIKDNKIIHHYQMEDDGRKRIKLSLSYNGYGYHGFQKQANQTTIQSVVETALTHALKEDIEIVSSGRTDRHVNANQQVIHFDTTSLMPIDKYHYIINAILPDDIYAYDIEEVPKAFHARFDVQQKEYLYILNTGDYNATLAHNQWFVGKLDIEQFRNTLNTVLGTHDFYGFSKRPQTKNTVRTIDHITVKDMGDDTIHVLIRAKGFLRHMVRYIIGATVMIVQNRVSYTLDDVFQTKDNEIIKTLANPSGLYLNKVLYKEENSD